MAPSPRKSDDGRQVGAGLCRTARERVAVVVGHGDPGDEEDDRQHGEGPDGDEGLVAVQAPDEMVHGATSTGARRRSDAASRSLPM